MIGEDRIISHVVTLMIDAFINPTLNIGHLVADFQFVHENSLNMQINGNKLGNHRLYKYGRCLRSGSLYSKLAKDVDLRWAE